MRALGWLLALWALGCSDPLTRVDLTIVVDSCGPGLASPAHCVALEVYGHDADGEVCTLERREFPVDTDEPDDLGGFLAELPQPLIDMPLEGAFQIAVRVFKESDCTGQLAYGAASLASAENGVLIVELTCSLNPADPVDACPQE